MNEHTDDLDRELEVLVGADPLRSTGPDLAALRAGGRRHLVRRRLAIGAGAFAVAVAVAVPVAAVGLGGTDRQSAPPVATSTPTPTPTTTPTQAPTDPDTSDITSDPPPPDSAEPASVPIPGGGQIVGSWELGTVLGAMVEVTPYAGYEQVVYAANGCINLGLRVDRRILRLLCAVTVPPSNERFPLWGGARQADALYDDDPDPHYLLVGQFDGDTEVSIASDAQQSRPVTTVRTDVLPGHTVFIDQAPWDESWDELQLAPLTVTSGSGESLYVPRRSYVS